MSVVYPELDSPEFIAGFQEATAAVDQLDELFDRFGIGSARSDAVKTSDETVFETILEAYNQVLAETRTLFV